MAKLTKKQKKLAELDTQKLYGVDEAISLGVVPLGEVVALVLDG